MLVNDFVSKNFLGSEALLPYIDMIHDLGAQLDPSSHNSLPAIRFHSGAG